MHEELMKEPVYMPVDYIPEAASKTPVIFLAGPIQGTGDWQSEASRLIHARSPGVIVASPRRAYLPGEFDYGKQVDWETHHLHRAAQNGAILFWLAREEEHLPSRAYAQTSRFELAEWKLRHERDGVKIVIGIEEGFSGERYIRRRFSQDCPEVPILTTLLETCERVLEAISSSHTR
jgi:Nucleoside 2-deoxyribosyltransferase like